MPRKKVPGARRITFLLMAMCLAVLRLAAQSPGEPSPSPADRPRIALYEPSGLNSDSTLTAALCTVADSVELDLACLQRFEVRRLPAVDPDRDMAAVRSYCEANRIDQAVLGSGTARPAGGYAFRLMLYDRRTDTVTLAREGSCQGALDMFDITDTLVAALLDKLSGTHLLFGSLTVQTVPEGATVSLNGKEVGPSPISLRGLPVGTVSITARSPGWEDGGTTATVEDNQIADVTLALQRSTGTLSLDMPTPAVVTLRAAGADAVVFKGAGARKLPVGTYEAEAVCAGLESVRKTLDLPRNGMLPWTPWPGALKGGRIVWTEQTQAGRRFWQSIAVSSDGGHLAACVHGGDIFTSTDAGLHWTDQKAAGSRNWVAIASSSDGNRLAACADWGDVYTSTDGWVTWTDQKATGTRSWLAIASSSDGSRLVAGGPSAFSASDDGGRTWVDRKPAESKSWMSIAASSDCRHIVAGSTDGSFYVTDDGGTTWTARKAAGQSGTSLVGSSSDGGRLVACSGGFLFASRDGGGTWERLDAAGTRGWAFVASSSDGTRLAACAVAGDIYTSQDGGKTWTDEKDAGMRAWKSVAFSSDGTRLVAGTYGGSIFTGVLAEGR